MSAARTACFVAALLAAPAPITAQAPAPCTCQAQDDRDHDHDWWWLLIPAGLVGGLVGVRPDAGDFVPTGLTERAPGTIATTDAAAPARSVVIPLPTTPVRTMVADARSCVPVAATRRPRVTDRERRWWRSLSPAQKTAVDRANQEREQRRRACLVLLPAAVPALGYLGKLAWAARVAAA